MLKNLKSEIKSLISLTLLLSYPLLVLIIWGWFVIPFKEDYLKEVLAFGLLTAVVTGLVLLFNKLKIKLFLVFLWFLTLFVFFKLFFYQIFGAKLSASSLFVFFETNFGEVSEFAGSYVDFKSIILLLICISFPILILILKPFKKVFSSFKRFHLNPLLANATLIFLIVTTLYMLKTRFADQSLIFILSNSYKEYNETKANIKSTLAISNNDKINILSKNDDEQIGVVIIGEATSRWHMQLYGYNRETNPLLTEIKDELLIFNDVIAPNVMTIRSLEKALTLKSYESPKDYDNFSAVQLANKVNYDTYWISNQQPVGYTESTPTIIATAAKSKQFLTTDSYFYNIYDENLLPHIETALNKKGNRKIIFLHLIGTHRLYKKRYPSSYSYFTGVNERTKFKTEYSKEKVNEYDNAIRYNDYVVRQIIEQVKAKDKSSFVIYFSDHGDDVFDTIDFVGHHGSKASRPMHEIPFIAWFSETYKSKKNLNTNVDTPYSLEDFIYSFSDLINTDFEGYDETRSIFSDAFIKRKRWIRNQIDYDQWK